MDLQEKLNEIEIEIKNVQTSMQFDKERMKELKQQQKGYLKLIEKAKALEKH